MSAQQKKPIALVLGGASSLLGQSLVEAGQQRGWHVETLGRGDGDIKHPEFLEKHLARLNPDYLFNTIAYTAVDAAEDNEEEALCLNRSLPALLGRLVRGSQTWLCHYSTDFVFNGKKREPYVESDSTGPLCVYGSSKLAGEQALLALGLPDVCVVRTAWLFGPGKKNFVSTILQLAAGKSSISVVHDQIGSPSSTSDVAQYSLALAEKHANGLFHAVNTGQASWCELACEAVALANLPCQVHPIPSAQWPQKAKRPEYSVLCTQKLTSLTAIQPRPWPQALRDYIFQHSNLGD